MTIGNYRSGLDIQLGQVPDTIDTELYMTLTEVFNAIQILANNLEEVQILDATSTNAAVTLPPAGLVKGTKYTIKRIGDSANTATVSTSNNETIDFAGSSLTLAYLESVVLYSDGANWLKL